jgi:hypothetical protein
VSLGKVCSTFARVIVLSSSGSVSPLGLLYFEDKRKNESPKRQEIFIKRHRVTSQNTRTFSNKTVRAKFRITQSAINNIQLPFVHPEPRRIYKVFCDIIWYSVFITDMKFEM